jgi:outer membrane protein
MKSSIINFNLKKMKKLFIISALALIAFNANAQKGSFYVGASNISFINSEFDIVGTGISHMSQGSNGGTAYGIAPELGYYLSDNVILGGIIGFSGYTLENSAGSGFNFGFRPYVRYFLYKGEHFGFYLQGGIGFLHQKNEIGNAEKTVNTWDIAVLPGVSYALSSHFGISASFGQLGYESEKEKGTDAMNTFGLNLNASTLNFTLSYTF